MKNWQKSNLAQGRDKRTDLFNVFPVIGKAWHLMLSSQFTFTLQPGGKYALLQSMEDGHAKGDVLIPFSLVIAVDALQGLIQLVDELIQLARLFFKLHQPFMGAISVVAEIDGGCRVIIDHRSRFLTGNSDGLVRIVYDDLFSKCIDEMFEPAADLDAERKFGGELDGVPQQ